MVNLKVYNKLTHKELADRFIEVNSSVNVISWQPMIGDECESYADLKQPIIRVDLSDGNWLRVYISKEYSEITWY